MANRTSFKLTGAKELEANLKALGRDVATKAGAEGLRAAGVEVRDAVQAAAPYRAGDTTKTWRNKDGSKGSADYGHLRDNIKLRKRRAKRRFSILYVLTTGNAFWARFSEYGTEHEQARPWLRPTLAKQAGPFFDAITQEIQKAIDRAVRRAKK